MIFSGERFEMSDGENYNFTSHSLSVLRELFLAKRWADVTLVTDDQRQIKSHKFLLTGCNFQNVLLSECQTIYLRAVSRPELECLLENLHMGQADVVPHRLEQFLEVTSSLNMTESNCPVISVAHNTPAGGASSSPGEMFLVSPDFLSLSPGCRPWLL